MVQIVRRKKKGRPSKADLARRISGGSPPEIRRSHRRRSVRYSVIDYDDYEDDFDDEEVDDDDDDDDEDEERTRRREKKLKLVVKLACDEVAAARGAHALSEDERDRKKQRVNGDEDEGEEEEDNGDGDENDGVEEDDDDDDDVEERGRKVDSERLDSVPGTPTDARSGVPLPEKRILELILDKLQKKDTYGVYAEPVDAEELPDYHDVIEHPMDFTTVRKRLADGSYSLLEQLESDVFLICSNAMQYNSSDTVYHKQARAIQELGRKKFEKLRIKFEAAEREMKLAQKLKSNSSVTKYEPCEEENKFVQKIKPNSSVKKQIRKHVYRTSQETVGSDFSSGATLATASEILNSMSLTPGVGFDKPSNNDVPVEALNDINLEKAEETSSAKGFLSKLGRKPLNLEDNRRSTYNTPSQPVIKSDSVFTTFESEIKQLVAVGLHAEYAYARSMARFAATLGPLAWKVASQRIESVLPAGYKFGRGWVGEYEPLPTPVLMLENHNTNQSGFVTKNNTGGETRKNEKASKTPIPLKEKSDVGNYSEGRQSLFVPSRGPQNEVKPSAFSSAGPQAEAKPSAFSSSEPQQESKPSAFSSTRPRPESNPSAFSSTGRKSNKSTGGATHQHKNAQSRSFVKSEINLPKQVELNELPTPNQNKSDIDDEKRFSKNPEPAAAVAPPRYTNGVGPAGFPNGKDLRTSMDHRISSPPPSAPNHTTIGPTHQGVSDPVQLKVLAEKPHKLSDHLPPDPQQVVPSVRRDDSNNAAAAAARAWMSIGAGVFKHPMESQISADSLYNPARESHSQSQLQSQSLSPTARIGAVQHFQPGFPVPAFFSHPQMAAHFQNRPMMFPQMAAADLSRFQMQPPWHSLGPQAQSRQRQDSLPPDLNIGFQSPQSPVKQSSGVMVESQQPDLALQL